MLKSFLASFLAPLFAAAFVDSDGNTEVLHISDYSDSANPEAELVKRINQQLLTYDFSIGWYSTGVARYHEDTQEYLDGVDSDLAILHNRCVANDVDSIVEFNSADRPYLIPNRRKGTTSFSTPLPTTGSSIRSKDLAKKYVSDSAFGYFAKFKTTLEREYQRHIVLKHPGKSGYPNMSVIENTAYRL